MERRAHAEQLAHLIPREQLHPKTLAAADASATAGQRWLVAVSGGADSVALLLSIWAHWTTQRPLLGVAHFNHGLRGEESDMDEAFCRKLSEDLGLAFFTQRWTGGVLGASEAESRAARYAFFESVADTEKFDVLFTGHQKDDIVETQLMRLARGASSAGLAAPRPWRVWGRTRTILRPLLNLERGELQAALRSIGVVWREDSSNAGHDYFRNRIRLSVVPKWLQASGAGALDGAALTREWFEEDDEALEHVLDRLGVPKQTHALNLDLLVDQPRALWRRALRRWIPLGDVSRRGFDDLLTTCQKGQGRLSLGAGFAVIDRGVLRWTGPGETALAAWSPARLWIGVVLVLPNGTELGARTIEAGEELRERFRRGAVDSASEAVVRLPRGEFIVRSWMSGDRYQPLGAPGSAKLQDLFVNRKVPASQRHQLPVICSLDGFIIWVPGFPPAAHFKVTDECVSAVQLTYSDGTHTVRK